MKTHQDLQRTISQILKTLKGVCFLIAEDVIIATKRLGVNFIIHSTIKLL
jgi:hypothetical protein